MFQWFSCITSPNYIPRIICNPPSRLFAGVADADPGCVEEGGLRPRDRPYLVISNGFGDWQLFVIAGYDDEQKIMVMMMIVGG